jgi:hypothetical protein
MGAVVSKEEKQRAHAKRLRFCLFAFLAFSVCARVSNSNVVCALSVLHTMERFTMKRTCFKQHRNGETCERHEEIRKSAVAWHR